MRLNMACPLGHLINEANALDLQMLQQTKVIWGGTAAVDISSREWGAIGTAYPGAGCPSCQS